MRLRTAFLLSLLTAAAAGAQPSAPRPAAIAEAETAIRNMAVEYTAAVAAGDVEKFLTFFSDDVIVEPPDAPALRGKTAFAAWAAPFFSQFTMEEALSYEMLDVQGDQAYGAYAYTFTLTPKAGGAPITETGKGMVILKRSADGSWQWTRSLWNRDHPAR